MTVPHLHGRFLPDEAVRHAWIAEGRLTFDRPPPGVPTADLAVNSWFIPGLVDAHCHVGISPLGHVTDSARQAEQAMENREAGALLLRDAGSPVDTSWMAARADLPRVIRAGRHIARTNRYIRDQAVEVEPELLVDEVATQAERSDGWVKIALDWIDRDVGDLRPTFPKHMLAAAVARAHELGARIAVHAFGEEAAHMAVAAGVDSIEHATGMTEDLLDEASRAGVATVPTLINIDHFPAIALRADRKFPVYARHMRSLYGSSRDRVRASWEAGVPIFVGTDAGGTVPHGQVRSEVAALAGAGLPLAYVLAQASWDGRAWLGLPGLVEGAPADILGFDDDPRSDLTTLFRARVIVLRGTRVD